LEILTVVIILSAISSVRGYCNARQCTATHCNAWQHTAAYCNALQHTDYWPRGDYSTFPRWERILQHTATHCNTLQHAATHCNIPQHTATYCSILQHTATQHTDCGPRGRGGGTISRLLKIVGLFCKRAYILQKRLHSAKETYNFKDPTNRSHPIVHFCDGATQHTTAHCNTLQHIATHCNTPIAGLEEIVAHFCDGATHGNTRQHTATHGNTRQHTATHCNTPNASLEEIVAHFCNSATHGNSLQHTATHCNAPIAGLEEIVAHFCDGAWQIAHLTFQKFKNVFVYVHGRF